MNDSTLRAHQLRMGLADAKVCECNQNQAVVSGRQKSFFWEIKHALFQFLKTVNRKV